MTLLNGGFQAVLGAAFAAFYADGTLRKVALTDDGTDSFTSTLTDVPVKVLAESLSDRDRAAGGLPRTATSLSVLRAGLGVEISLDDSVTIGGLTYRVVQVDSDPGAVAYRLVGVLA